MHSREFYRMLAVMLALTAAAAIGQSLVWGVPGMVAALLLGGALTALAVVYTLRRYRRIGQLSEYLAQVYTGGQPPRLSGQTPGELSALQDDLYKITSILQQQAAALEADKRFLADSLSDIAHQLRTPLSAILLQCDFLREELPPGEAEEGLAQIETQTGRIRWLVEALLRLSRLDAGVVPFEKKEHPARQVLQRAAGGLAEFYLKRGVELQADCPEGLFCVCDLEWTAEALANLLKNAAEHTPPGGRVQVEYSRQALYFEFRVQNEGSAVPEEELPRLFERFWRGASASPGSVGIGLPLARSIARGQQGDVTAENTPEGPLFRLRLFR
ncbi:MAG: HAMP domain-containing sensor histidine kinase [Fournierella sp.]|uniref:sensor histidine kinase n=1 Tax=Allofournierella sp. TaxID=1940256 RepID=UPI002A81A91B|nr:HAMP domain-containing sensor histidine kinase [Fournierella sp.]MDY4166234.1 HAMP domain-containing sensor histidine kinase [Fournierella sp.]